MRYVTVPALLLAAASAFATPSNPDLAEVYAIYQSGRHQQALPGFQQLARGGDLYAQSMLAQIYDLGHGTQPDPAKALYWGRLAAERGDTDAQARLGKLHAEGKGTPQDLAAAAHWFRKAAQQGHAAAQFNLGVLLLEGRGQPPAPREGLQWLEQSNAQGFAPASAALAMALLRDHTQDPARGLQLAAQADARTLLAPDAQRDIGELYAQGLRLARDDAQALHWFGKAAERGDAYAQNRMGDLLSPRNAATAESWYRKAIASGSKAAQAGLARLLTEREDYPALAVHYRTMAEQGNDVAMYNLATLYERGAGVPKDLAQAIALYRQAAAAGNEPARKHLAKLVSGTSRR